MPAKNLFVSYAREDARDVLPVVDAVREEYRLRGLDVDVWMDVTHLSPGERWETVLTRALQESLGILVFVSPAAMKSEWVNREVVAAAEHKERLIIPVILKHVPDLPQALASRQWIDLSTARTKADRTRAAQLIADATAAQLGIENAPPPVAPGQAPPIAADAAGEARGA